MYLWLPDGLAPQRKGQRTLKLRNIGCPGFQLGTRTLPSRCRQTPDHHLGTPQVLEKCSKLSRISSRAFLITIIFFKGWVQEWGKRWSLRDGHWSCVRSLLLYGHLVARSQWVLGPLSLQIHEDPNSTPCIRFQDLLVCSTSTKKTRQGEGQRWASSIRAWEIWGWNNKWMFLIVYEFLFFTWAG